MLPLNDLMPTIGEGKAQHFRYYCRRAFKSGVINNRTAGKNAVKLNENAGQSWASMPVEVHRNCASYFPTEYRVRMSRCSAVHRDVYQVAHVRIGLQLFSDNSKLFLEFINCP